MPFQRELRDLAYVPRWSIVRVAKPQSVAEHSFFTAIYSLQIARLIHWVAEYAPLVELALWHDAEECFTGDAPGPVKHTLYGPESGGVIARMMTDRFEAEWMGPSIAYTPQGYKEAKAIIRAASLVDDALYLMGELQRGNEACHAATHSVIKRLKKAWLALPGEQEVKDQAWDILRISLMRERDGYSVEPDRELNG